MANNSIYPWFVLALRGMRLKCGTGFQSGYNPFGLSDLYRWVAGLRTCCKAKAKVVCNTITF